MLNQQFKLAARPVGLPKRSDFNYEEIPVTAPGPGQLLVKVHYISLDPAMRGWMNPGRSYIAPVEVGAVMRAGTVGEVIASNHPSFVAGEYVSGMLGVQSFALSDGQGLMKINPQFAALPKFLSVLGMPGFTGYFGLLDIGRPQAGETVLVSSASGAVGAIVGQIAKIHGCRVVGIAGGEAKCNYVVNELGFDACIDYKRGPIFPGLAKHCPDGVDIYFDNVGGEILDTTLTRLRRHGRIIICGAISQYNATAPVPGPKNYMQLLVNRARMEGFVVFDYEPRYPEAIQNMAQWMTEGRLKSREDIVDGIQTFPEALLRLFSGENFGKLVLRVA